MNIEAPNKEVAYALALYYYKAQKHKACTYTNESHV
jgi:hypothetical protein